MEPKNEGIDFRPPVRTRRQERIVAHQPPGDVVLFPNRDPALGFFLVTGDVRDVLSILSGGQQDGTDERRTRPRHEPEN